jgi:hypothetical protein
MLNKIAVIIIPILALFLPFNTVQKNNNHPRLPVLLVYKNITPDSIQMFIKLYLQSKKVKVVDQNELRKLVADEITSAGEEFYKDGNANKNAKKFIEDRLDPVGNILALQVFNSWESDSSYLIDSIKWKINYVPAKDTIPALRSKFISKDISEEKLYNNLKSFIDDVVSSGYLK